VGGGGWEVFSQFPSSSIVALTFFFFCIFFSFLVFFLSIVTFFFFFFFPRGWGEVQISCVWLELCAKLSISVFRLHIRDFLHYSSPFYSRNVLTLPFFWLHEAAGRHTIPPPPPRVRGVSNRDSLDSRTQIPPPPGCGGLKTLYLLTCEVIFAYASTSPGSGRAGTFSISNFSLNVIRMTGLLC
jgi:hypothetical protein